MSDPGRSRNVALLSLVGGIVAVVIAAEMPDAGKGFTLQAVLGIGGLTVIPFAFVLTLMRIADARRQARMLRGEDVVARWTIPPGQWQAFVANDEALSAERGGGNQIDVRRIPVANGVDVVITSDALSVGGDFHTFERNVSITVGPGWVELDQYVHDPNGSDVNLHYRFPTVPGVERDLERLRQGNAVAWEEAVANSHGKLYVLVGLFGTIGSVLFFLWFFG